MSKKIKTLIVFSFIFLALSVIAFIYSSALFSAMTTIGENGTASNLGEAVGVAVLIIFFIIVMIAFAVLDILSIVFGGILIKLTAGKWRVFYIVETAASAAMMIVEFVFFMIVKG
ncbi:MAG: hypothetical protein IJR55_00020 [Clostridia bacterium]|nr:hypothetical protein [Clostridia bacterium]